MIPIFISGLLLVCVLSLATACLFALRHRSQRRHLKFEPGLDRAVRFSGNGVEIIEVRCDREGFVAPALPAGITSGFLELDVKATLAGISFDPKITLEGGGFYDEQTVERGGSGLRFFNVSRLLGAGLKAGQKVRLHGKRLRWRSGPAYLHLSREQITNGQRVLVIAPHPDDAEIAAFGLYSDTRATVVNLTAGDDSDRYQSRGRLPMNLPRSMIARMRVLESITIPQLGGVNSEQAVNLCFPDGKLTAMRDDPARDFRSASVEAFDFAGLRQLNRSPLIRDGADCSWNSLIFDLVHILAETKPAVIVLPHPKLDPHPDHLAATAAVVEAMRQVGLSEGRMFFTLVHNRRSELWPFGPAGSGVAMLPLLECDGQCGDSFYSHPLSAERQTEKFVALEAMHDVREVEWPVAFPSEGAGRRLKAELRALGHGMGRAPTSYLRRAVRPDELFLTASFANGIALCQQAGIVE